MPDIPDHVVKVLAELEPDVQGRLRDLFEQGANMTFTELSLEMRDWSGREAKVAEIPGADEHRWQATSVLGALEFDPADYASEDHAFGLSCADTPLGLISTGEPIRRADDGSISWVSNGGEKTLDVRLV